MRIAQQWFSNPTSNPILMNSAYAVSLAVLGRQTKCPRFLQAAIEVYASALRGLRRRLDDLHSDKMALAGITHMLAMTELFFVKSLDDARARPNTRMTLLLIESYRQEPESSKAHPMFQAPTRLLATWESLISRNLPPGVRTCHGDTATPSLGSLSTLSNLTIHTVSMIEDSDDFCKQAERPVLKGILDVLNSLVQLESRIHSWIATHYQSTSGSLYHFSSTTKPSCGSETPIFRVAYDFSDLEGCILHIGYWMCLLTLVESQLDIMAQYRDVLDPEPAELIRLEKLSGEYADNICMSIPFMGKRESRWSGKLFAIRPLRFLLAYFKKRSSWQKLGWCVQCAKDLEI